MGQAQRLLEEVSRQAKLHAALQCKQRDEQKEIIKKHEVIHYFFTVVEVWYSLNVIKVICSKLFMCFMKYIGVVIEPHKSSVSSRGRTRH